MNLKQAPAELDATARLATIGLTVIAMAVFLVLPMFIGAVADGLGFSPSQLGWTASAVGTGSAVGSVGMMLLVRRIRWRQSAALLSALLLTGTAASLTTSSFSGFLLCQSLAALGGGGLYSLALTALSDSSQADRDFGFSVAAQVSFQVLGMMTIPALTTTAGLSGLLMALLALQLLGLLLCRWLPERCRSAEPSPTVGFLLQLPVLLSLFGCLFFFANVGAVWAYLERFATVAGISATDIGNSLAIGVAAGVPGALIASWSGDRMGRALPLSLAALATVVSVYLLGAEMSGTDFLIAAVIYNVAWNYSLTYQYAAVNAVDRSGRAVAAAPAFHAAGAALGPGMAAMAVSESALEPVSNIAAVAVISSLLCFVLALRHIHSSTSSTTGSVI